MPPFIDDDTALTCDKGYLYKVKTISLDSESSWSADVNFITFSTLILTPVHGRRYKIGDTVRILISSSERGKAGIRFGVGRGAYPTPGVTSVFYPFAAPSLNFVIPDFVLDYRTGSVTQMPVVVRRPPVCNSCYFDIFNYDDPSESHAILYDYFVITPREGSGVTRRHAGSSFDKNTRIDRMFSRAGASRTVRLNVAMSGFRIYAPSSRLLWSYSRKSEGSLSVFISQVLRHDGPVLIRYMY